MALFGFGKKRPITKPAAPATGVPTDLVIQMRQQGMSNNQIVQNLQGQGYSSSEIFDAMNQADVKGAVEEGAGATGGPMPSEETYQGTQPSIGFESNYPPSQEVQGPASPMPAAQENERERIEEIAESIIDEKWDELMKSVDKIIAWKETAETRMIKIEQAIKDLKERFEELHKGILTKIGEYDQGIRNVGTEIKAMEGVFKKVLPSLTENVGQLSRITQSMKSKKKK